MRAFTVAVIAICMVSVASAQPKKPKGSKPPPPPPPAPVVSAEKARADALFEDGRRYLEKKEYALACTAFEQSNAADPAIGTLLNIALCYETWGKTASAYRWYLESERSAREKKDDREKGAREKVDELAPKVPHLQVNIPETTEKSVVYLLDGKETTREKLADDLLLDPGSHDIEVRVPGREPKKTTVELKNGERKRVTLEMPRAPVKEIITPRNTRRLYGGIALIGGGALTMGAAGFVALIARQDYVNAIEDCPMQTCTQRDAYDKTQDARSRATYMTFVTIGGAAIVGAGIYFILTSKGKPITVERTALELTPVIGPDGLGFAVGGSF
jgi:hypothetical protein